MTLSRVVVLYKATDKVGGSLLLAIPAMAILKLRFWLLLRTSSSKKK